MRTVHASAGNGSGWTLCGMGQRSASSYWPEVTCLECLAILPRNPPTYPRYPSRRYCPTCGMSFSCWQGCPGAS